MCVCIYIYIYIYTHTYIDQPRGFFGAAAGARWPAVAIISILIECYLLFNSLMYSTIVLLVIY